MVSVIPGPRQRLECGLGAVFMHGSMCSVHLPRDRVPIIRPASGLLKVRRIWADVQQTRFRGFCHGLHD
jgi:hypothetical protein